MSQQWKIIVIGSLSQQLAWYGWMAEANVNPFLPTAANPQLGRPVLPKNQIPQVTHFFPYWSYLKHWRRTGSSTLGSVAWRHIDSSAVGISETCFHAKETLWQVVRPYAPRSRCKESNSRDPSATELPNASSCIFSFPQTVPSPLR